MKLETVDNEIDYMCVGAELIESRENFRINLRIDGRLKKWFEMHFDDEGREVYSENSNGEVHRYRYDSAGRINYRGYTAPTRGGKVPNSA